MFLKLKLALTSFIFLLVIFPTVAISAEPPGLANSVSNCDSGLTQACIDVGVAYMRGEFKGQKVNKDKAKAKKYVNQAIKRGQQNCVQGDSAECYTLGLLFFEGGGVVPIDIPRGLDYLQRSCKGGYKKACDWLDNSGLRGGM